MLPKTSGLFCAALLTCKGSPTTFFKMVNCFLRNLHPGCAGLRPRHFWQPGGHWRASNRSVGVDDWQHHGLLHSQLRCVLKKRMPPETGLLTHVVAELVSAYPTAGGMYYVTKHVVPKDRVAPWAWIVGWCNFLGQAGGVASLAYTISQMILATAVMHSVEDSKGVPSFAP